MLENGSTATIPNIVNMEIPGETIICDFSYDTERFPQYQTISIQDVERIISQNLKKEYIYYFY